MIVKTVKEVSNMIPGSELINNGDIKIEGVSIDTRTIKKNNLFIPIKGEHFNGHQFIDKAIENGAVATLWNKDEPNPPQHLPVVLVEDTLKALQTLAETYRDQLNVKVVGITGSNGKTTTKDMVEAVLSTKYNVLKTEGNFNNHIGLPLTLLRMEKHTEIAILEMGMSSRGEIEFLSNLAKPDIAVITNIGESHLQDLGSREGIAEAKLEIICGLQENGELIYTGDEPLLVSRLKDTAIKTVTFGQSKALDLYPVLVEQQESGTRFTINQHENVSFFVPVLGQHNVHNALASIAVGRYFHLPLGEIAEGLKNLRLTSMRMEVQKAPSGLTIINDAYNASPTSMKAAIQLLKDMDGYEKRILVLGDMLELGNQEKQFHFEIGQFISPSYVDYVFAYGPLSAHIIQGAKSAFTADRIAHFTDKQELAKELETIASPQDIIIVKGSRGMKLEEVIHHLLEKQS
ncbi:UDP-N-acetylmuramoyl-tripeptide--D-alanyl-D-alanine ligase [Metabacillus iocasae]|uniref:UDP-N-acetylmuramoyl-tripeptide--D-alanyl-D-alanine ligase n=1 Tax=Priestia iocasae TaxID=2291674 RepID=A0ABS2QZV3_9BACI|nr:UDP-N-acetylmuramoyl-tripeptide--D-alanyl-D-alanine ligase [Metabacillus iocasae]MBM7705015.1 UDP-N-acetylmuramoyl-tripeptide--D-alanyl-D-alanine ligase [Metabacillus iocasae]